MPTLLGKPLEAEEAFGLVVRDLRQSKRLSQEALAFEAGLDRNYISLVELGKSSPSVKTVFKLCDALRLPPSRLFELVQEKMGATSPRNEIEE